MNPFVDPKTNFLRSGWRALLFLFFSPLVLIALSALLPEQEAGSVGIGLNWATIISYVLQIGWLMFASWLCLKFLEHLSLAALGFAFFRGWWRETWLGFSIAAAMIGVVVVAQIIGGGTRLMLNPIVWKTVDGARMIDFIGVGLVVRHFIAGLVLFAVGAAFEELLFRGYAFQTLLRGGISPVVPIFLLSLFFGLVHLGNPSSTIFSTLNTILAGVWLAVAYLKTRSLWFPTALHLGWNWTMGVFFGLPVSGLKLTRYPVFLSTSEAPLWLTGGAYGSEGGVAATLILMVATVVIWRAPWLRVAPEMEKFLQPRETKAEEKIRLGLID